MEKILIPAYYHPTSIMFVDDNRNFLINVSSELSELDSKFTHQENQL